MNHHAYGDGCTCSTCARHFRNYALFIGSICVVVLVLGLLSALDLLYQLFSGVKQ